jgi:hypothetical protein
VALIRKRGRPFEKPSSRRLTERVRFAVYSTPPHLSLRDITNLQFLRKNEHSDGPFFPLLL